MPDDTPFPDDANPIADKALSQRIVNLIAKGYSPRELERQIFLFELKRLEKQQPRLVHLIRVGAIPPYVNAEIIGAIREKLNETETNNSLFMELRALRFMEPHPQGAKYDAAARNFLLEDWDASPHQLERYRQRLASYFELLGKERFLAEDYGASIDAFSHALKLNPDSTEAYSRRAKAYSLLGHFDKALSDLDHLAIQGVDNGDTSFWKGRTLYGLGRMEEALDCFHRALRLEPEQAPNYHWRGRTFFGLERFSEALSDFSQAIE